VLFGQSCSSEDANFVQIINSPEKFDEKEIEISGVYHARFEDVAIYLNSDSDTEKAMWVELDGSNEELDGKRIKLKGKFDINDKGHLGQYMGTIRAAKIIED